MVGGVEVLRGREVDSNPCIQYVTYDIIHDMCNL